MGSSRGHIAIDRLSTQDYRVLIVRQKKYFPKGLRNQNSFAILFNCERKRVVSSVGRAPALQAGCHWFESSTTHFYSKCI